MGTHATPGPARISRRHLLVSSSGVLGIAVLGPLAGCSGSDGTPGESTGPAATTGTAAMSGSPAAGGLAWHRVPLDFVSAYLLVRGGEVAIVDTGVSGSADAIGAGLAAVGSGWSAVRHVLLTHRHPDHVGGLPSVERQTPDAAVYAGADDLAAIDAGGRRIQPLAGGHEVFGLQVVATPGHTAGHVSVFDPATGVLVAGDALRSTGSGLVGSDPQYTESQARAAASVRTLAALVGVTVILPGHGEPVTRGAAEALKNLAASISG